MEHLQKSDVLSVLGRIVHKLSRCLDDHTFVLKFPDAWFPLLGLAQCLRVYVLSVDIRYHFVTSVFSLHAKHSSELAMSQRLNELHLVSAGFLNRLKLSQSVLFTL